MPLSLDHLPDPLPDRIVMRLVGFSEPGFVLVTADGKKIAVLNDVTDEDFEALCEDIQVFGYARQLPAFIDDVMLVVPFERTRAAHQDKEAVPA